MTFDFNVAILSVVVIAALAWLLRRYGKLPICPICAGVAGTWLWLLAARQFGATVDPVTLGLLLGACAVGIAYQLEKRLATEHSPLLWKALFIPVGLAAAHSVVVEHWISAGLLVAAAVGLGWYFLVARGPSTWLPSTRLGTGRAGTRHTARESEEVQKIEKSLEKCC